MVYCVRIYLIAANSFPAINHLECSRGNYLVVLIPCFHGFYLDRLEQWIKFELNEPCSASCLTGRMSFGWKMPVDTFVQKGKKLEKLVSNRPSVNTKVTFEQSLIGWPLGQSHRVASRGRTGRTGPFLGFASLLLSLKVELSCTPNVTGARRKQIPKCISHSV